MKNFKQYNENVKDLLVGKSNDEVLKELEGLTPSVKFYKIWYHNLFAVFSKEDIKKILENVIEEHKDDEREETRYDVYDIKNFSMYHLYEDRWIIINKNNYKFFITERGHGFFAMRYLKELI